MEPVFVDLHIHTSNDPEKPNLSYDVDLLKSKVELVSEGSPYLISLTDHNFVNKQAYLNAVGKIKHILLGVELHVRNYDEAPPYHCHIFFDLPQINAPIIDDINAILDELYPQKIVSNSDDIPKLEKIMKHFDAYDFLLLPHGGQTHSTFDESIPKGVQFDNTLERSIYYNHFDGFTARSNTKLEKIQGYFERLGIKEFVNLVTATDNYSPKDYPSCKASDASPFIKTWMLASPTFNGLRLSLSESSRLQYGNKPDTWAEYIQHVNLKNDKVDIDTKLTPGLNVVIGGSSSGKTLFVDSIYRKIADTFAKCSYDSYGIQDIQVRNPSGQRPHYFFQNYIIEICKEKENKIDSIPILRSIFPEDKDERQKIENGLSELKSRLDALVESVERIEALQEELLPLPHISSLIYTEAIPDNPLKYVLPTQPVIESIRYSKAEYDREFGYLNTIDIRLNKNPLIRHDKQLIERLKEELALAFTYSETEASIREIISRIKAEIDSQQAMVKREATTKRQQFDSLLECIANYFKFHHQFYESLNAISEFSINSPTKKIESMGHTLFVENEFELTKGKFLEVVNSMLTKEHEIDTFESIRPEALFKSKFKQRPKIPDYVTFKNKVASAFADMNKKKYKIHTKEGKDFETLSAGWKTAIILDLILGSESDNAPLIIDQPEDNLATNYINSGLLKAIKECKTRKQIILVSHNATIPMLGDAQNIILCRNDGNKITIRSNPLEGKIGNNDVVDLIAEITDGGKISVKKRVKKYNLKKFRSSNETSIQEG